MGRKPLGLGDRVPEDMKLSKAEVQIPAIYADLPTVSALVTLSEASIQKMVTRDEFPKPRQLSGRRVGWLLREVTEWAESRPHSDLAPPPNTGARKGRRQLNELQPGSQDDQTAV